MPHEGRQDAAPLRPEPLSANTPKAPRLDRLPDDVQVMLRRVIDFKPSDILDYLHPMQFRAAVLVPLQYNSATGQIEVQLTQRGFHMRSHGGEVAFPGGKKDETDSDDVETALREAMEEINLSSSELVVLGQMDPTVSRGLLAVQPVVALVAEDFEPIFNPDEVHACFKAELASFLSPEDHTSDDMTSWNGSPWRMHRFQRNGYSVTGMTAYLLVSLAELVYGFKAPFGAGAPGQSDDAMIRHLVSTGRFQWKDGSAPASEFVRL
ncbi:NUDIX hydrolase domain-like protein [Hyaloraphidium curvatum]|nr:NUDIX hydrolase domain-like protein [Hyaloraphidium curvatum]